MAGPELFLRKDWDLDLRAELYKQEFYATRTWASNRHRLVVAWDTSTTEELTALRRLKKTERPAYVGEIIREQQGPAMIARWYNLLKIGPTTRPATSELLHATIYLAGSVATYFKARFNRVRPWVLAPDLSPPVPSPGLPSYPGGHAAQIHLMALTLVHLVPDREPEITEIADQVAVNRERAGLNYRSDTESGRALARDILEILKSECKMFQSMLEKAKHDTPWDSPVIPHPLRETGLPV